MTNETAKIKVEQLDYYLSHTCQDYGESDHTAMMIAISALKQEPILDKIRAEISDFEEEVFNRPNTDYSDYAAVRHCLEIIDKYKAESEDKK